MLAQQRMTTTFWHTVRGTLSQLASIGSYVITARKPLRPLDIAAITLKTVEASANIYELWRTEKAQDFSRAFSVDDDWRCCSSKVWNFYFETLPVVGTPIPEHQDIQKGEIKSAAWTCIYEGSKIGWVGEKSTPDTKNALYIQGWDAFATLGRNRLWERKGGPNHCLRVVAGELVPVLEFQSRESLDSITTTTFLSELDRRVNRSLETNETVAILLDGEPGTGKTTAGLWISIQRGLRTMIVDAADLLPIHSDGSAAATYAIERTNPESLVISDIDRLQETQQLQLISTLENIRRQTRLVFVSTNYANRLIEALRRPGRLDEAVEVPGLSQVEVEAMAPLAPTAWVTEMCGWPVAWVREVQRRVKLYGVDQREFDNVQTRLKDSRRRELARQRMIDDQLFLFDDEVEDESIHLVDSMRLPVNGE